MSLWRGYENIISESVSLAGYTTLGIGGEAEVFAQPCCNDELKAILRIAAEADMTVHVLGGGSNLLVNDSFINGVVVKLSSPYFRDINIDSETGIISAGAGAMLGKVVRTSIDASLAGLENMAGIPGTIGGAVVMNAGGAQTGIGTLVSSVCGYDYAGQEIRLGREDLEFGYRFSNLKDMIVAKIELELREGDAAELASVYAKSLANKRHTQPVGDRSAGCYFKNPEGDSAGRLIEGAGCKGMREGGAVVSLVHANYLVNSGSATFTDIISLAERVAELVYSKYHIHLEPEIQRWP